MNLVMFNQSGLGFSGQWHPPFSSFSQLNPSSIRISVTCFAAVATDGFPGRIFYQSFAQRQAEEIDLSCADILGLGYAGVRERRSAAECSAKKGSEADRR